MEAELKIELKCNAVGWVYPPKDRTATADVAGQVDALEDGTQEKADLSLERKQQPT